MVLKTQQKSDVTNANVLNKMNQKNIDEHITRILSMTSLYGCLIFSNLLYLSAVKFFLLT